MKPRSAATHASAINSVSTSAQTPLVVIDVETTGFSNSDRIVELSAITLNPETFETVEEYDTLVNPERDVSEDVTEVHGLTAAILEAAPTFKEVAPALARRLNASFLVAHNQSFDMRFLRNEFQRINAEFDAGNPICTYKLTGSDLTTACTNRGITIEDAHRALVDARATAEILRTFYHDDARRTALKDYTVARCRVRSEDVVIRTLRRENTELRTNLTRIAKSPWQDPLRDYRYALNLALDDGEISDSEWEELKFLSKTLGLSRPEVEEQHRILFERTQEAVMRDAYTSPAEEKMLLKMATNLGLNYEPPERDDATRALFIGMTVCFTGSGQGMLTRSSMVQVAEEKGISVKGGVSRYIDLVVAADVSSYSSKTQMARKLGKPVMSAVDFLQLVGRI